MIVVEASHKISTFRAIFVSKRKFYIILYENRFFYDLKLAEFQMFKTGRSEFNFTSSHFQSWNFENRTEPCGQ